METELSVRLCTWTGPPSRGDTYQLPPEPTVTHCSWAKPPSSLQTKWEWQRQPPGTWEGYHGEVLRKWEWEVPDKVQMIVPRGPSDERLMIFSADEGLLSGSRRWNDSPSDEGEGEGDGESLPLPTHSGAQLSLMQSSLGCWRCSVIYWKWQWYGLEDQATDWLWQRLLGSPICRSSSQTGRVRCDTLGRNVIGDRASMLPPDLPSSFPADTYAKRTGESALGWSCLPGTGELNIYQSDCSGLRAFWTPKELPGLSFFSPNDLDILVLWPSLAQCLHL